MAFRFSIGGYSDSFNVTCQRNLLTCVHYRLGEKTEEPVQKDISDNKAWNKMLEHLSSCQWEKNYTDPSILDGTSWRLEVKTKDFTLRSSRSNVYPPGFKKFLRLLNEVLKEDGVKVY